MRPGSKLSLYVSAAVAEDLALLAARYPGEPLPGLLRRALAELAAVAVADLAEIEAARVQREAYGCWN